MIGRYLLCILWGAVLLVGFQSATAQAPNQASDDPLSLTTAIYLAEKNDPWLKGNQFSQNEIESLAIAAEQLPDPQMSLGLMGIAADTFDFRQEGMSQLAVGISQMFPRGDTRELSKKRLNSLAQQYPHQRQNRTAELTVQVSQLWLSAFQAQESIRLINEDRALFEYLVDVAEASYATASGQTRQQDLIRAQLELTRLDDRLMALQQTKEQTTNQLNQYISNYMTNQFSRFNATVKQTSQTVSSQLPHIVLLDKHLVVDSGGIDKNRLYQIFSVHPAVKAIQQRIEATQHGIELARQKYKPAWGVNAS
ncbi:MAG: transporter, partial [Proteobacteria bacterium]